MIMSILKHVVALYCFISVPISAQNDEPMVSPPNTVPVTSDFVGKYHVLIKCNFAIKLCRSHDF